MWVEHRGRQVCMCGEWDLIVKMRVMEWGWGGFKSRKSVTAVSTLWPSWDPYTSH